MKTIRDYDLKSKKVIIRCDLNIPMKDNLIEDDTKIVKSIETIKYALSKGAKVIIMSHLGRIINEEDKQNNSLYAVRERLSILLNQKIYFSKVTHGIELDNLVANLKDGEVLLMENTRYEDYPNKLESNCDLSLAKYWASLGDIYINDAYATSHREHASNVGLATYLPSGIGFLVEEELTKINGLIQEDTHPYLIIMGGKKVSDKIKLIEHLITKCDYLLVGGAMSFTFLKAMDLNVGSSIIDTESLAFCQDLLTKYSNKIVLPIDFITSTSLEDQNPHLRHVNDIKEEESGFDIGPATINLFKEYLKDAKRVIVNGPLGVFEQKQYQNGTKEIYEYLAKNHIKTLLGGGDTTAAVNQFNLNNGFYHISTGGGATLEYLEGKDLVALKIIDEKEE